MKSRRQELKHKLPQAKKWLIGITPTRIEELVTFKRSGALKILPTP